MGYIAAKPIFVRRQAHVVDNRPGRGIHSLARTIHDHVSNALPASTHAFCTQLRPAVRERSSEVRIVERIFRDNPPSKPGGGLKDRPLCELCGRPVKVSRDDYQREEILCTHCAAEAKVSILTEQEAQ